MTSESYGVSYSQNEDHCLNSYTLDGNTKIENNYPVDHYTMPNNSQKFFRTMPDGTLVEYTPSPLPIKLEDLAMQLAQTQWALAEVNRKLNELTELVKTLQK